MIYDSYFLREDLREIAFDDKRGLVKNNDLYLSLCSIWKLKGYYEFEYPSKTMVSRLLVKEGYCQSVRRIDSKMFRCTEGLRLTNPKY
jgi:hypothetical protein